VAQTRQNQAGKKKKGGRKNKRRRGFLRQHTRVRSFSREFLGEKKKNRGGERSGGEARTAGEWMAASARWIAADVVHDVTLRGKKRGGGAGERKGGKRRGRSDEGICGALQWPANKVALCFSGREEKGEEEEEKEKRRGNHRDLGQFLDGAVRFSSPLRGKEGKGRKKGRGKGGGDRGVRDNWLEKLERKLAAHLTLNLSHIQGGKKKGRERGKKN